MRPKLALQSGDDTTEARPGQASTDFTLEWIGRILGGTERRQITVLAVGIGEDIAPPLARHAEEQMSALAGLRRAIGDIIKQLGGTAVGTGGDVLLACWGWPAASLDDTERAILAARRIVSLSDDGMAVTCGLDVGIAIAWREEADIFSSGIVGQVVQSAIAGQLLAHPGEVVVSGNVVSLCAETFHFRPLAAASETRPDDGSFVVTGLSANQACRPPSRGALVGRTAELELLLARAQAAATCGTGRAVLIEGDAGCGKSALLWALGRQLDTGAAWISVRCHEAGAGLPGPIRQLADALQVALGDSGSNRHPRRGEANSDIVAVVMRTKALCARTPCVLVVDDLHHAGVGTLRDMEALLAALQELSGMFLILCGRSPCVRMLSAENGPDTLSLGPMPDEDLAQIVHDAAGGAGLRSSDAKRLARLARGSPLIARELGALASGDPGVRDQLRLLSRPNRINPVLTGRLDPLGAARALAYAAAVIGRTFDVRVLAAVLQVDEERLSTLLAALVQHGIVATPDPSASTVLHFSDNLIWATCYGSVLRAKRRELHARAAEVVSGRFPEIAAQAPETVAHHHAKACEHALAFRWWHRAAHRASRLGYAPAIIEHARNALASRMEALDDCPAAQEAEILALLGTYIGALKGGANAETVAIYRRAVSLMSQIAEPPDDLSFDIGWGVTMIQLVHGDLQQALSTSRRLIEVADELVLPIALRLHASARLQGGQIGEAIEMFALAADGYDVHAHDALRHRYGSDPGATSLAHLAHAKAIAGDSNGSRAAERRALRMIAALEHPTTTAIVLGVLATAAQSRHDYATTAALASAAQAVSLAHGYENWSARADMMQGWLIARRDAQAGIQLVREALERYRHTGAGRAVVLAHCLIASMALDCGQPLVALDALEPIASGQELQREWLYAAEVMRLDALARFAADRCGAQTCLDRLAAAERLAIGQGAHLYAARARASRAALAADSALTKTGWVRSGR